MTEIRHDLRKKLDDCMVLWRPSTDLEELENRLNNRNVLSSSITWRNDQNRNKL